MSDQNTTYTPTRHWYCKTCDASFTWDNKPDAYCPQCKGIMVWVVEGKVEE